MERSRVPQDQHVDGVVHVSKIVALEGFASKSLKGNSSNARLGALKNTKSSVKSLTEYLKKKKSLEWRADWSVHLKGSSTTKIQNNIHDLIKST